MESYENLAVKNANIKKIMRMIEKEYSKEEILDIGYTEDEFNEAEFVANRRAEGREEERIKMIQNAIRKGRSKEEIMDFLDCTEKEFLEAESQMLLQIGKKKSK